MPTVDFETEAHERIDPDALAPDRIDPDAVYRPRQLARIMRVGPQTIYSAIQTGALRAAAVNDRGDLRIMGQWARQFLESRSITTRPAYSSRP